MQHADYLKHTFLPDVVNLNQSRLDKLEARVESVYAALVNDGTIGSMITGKIPQGSWPHQLIIKPTPNGQFDADFMLEMTYQPGWEPTRYIDEVYQALSRHSTYKLQRHGRKCRCVWLEYAAENDIGCHLDIVPFIALPDGRRVIVNRDDNAWEPPVGSTDPAGFTTWVERCDELTNKQFRRVVRLMKFIKMERGSFSGVRSIVLTTLLGMQITELDSLSPHRYSNLPTALLNIVENLDRFLQAQGATRPHLPNPNGDGTNFDHRWTDETYRNFRDRIHTIAADLRVAYDEPDSDKSITAWRKVLGDKFNPPNSTRTGALINPYIPASTAPIAVASSRSGRAG